MDENPAISTNNLYQVADVTLFPAGDHHVLLHNRHSQATLLVHTEIADLLMKCREFKTLRDHIQSYRHGQPTNVATMSALRRELQKLVHNGYLISNQHIFDQYSQLMKKAPTAHIESIGFPTCDRVEVLQRGLTSYINYCQQFERENDFVVIDDSVQMRTREAYRHMLQTLKSRYHVNILYAGVEEKKAFAQKLIEKGNIPAGLNPCDQTTAKVNMGDLEHTRPQIRQEADSPGSNASV